MSNYSPEELASLTKERPKNETDKRFVLSKEEFSKERLVAMKEEVDEMKVKHPEVLSLCLFGSMIKGTAHEGSDIDGYVYIDSGVVAQKEGVSEDQVLERHQIRDDIYLAEDIAKPYIVEFRNGIKEKTGLEDKDVEHIRSRPISEKVIEDRIRAVMEYYKNKEKYRSDMDQYDVEFDSWLKAKPGRGQSVDVLLEYEKKKPKRPSFPESVSTNLGSMFHLDVGGGIRKYRKMFIDKLSKLGPDGEKIWEDTIRSTEMMENNLSTDSSKRYPRTLKDAMETYGK